MAKQMTLREFIEEMKRGWGFARPGRVKRIGRALEMLIPYELLDETVEVEFKRGSSGSGPRDFRYWYLWTVKGREFEEKSLRVKSLVDQVFGYSSLPEIRFTKEGLQIYYEW